jgi:hypothetical protein
MGARIARSIFKPRIRKPPPIRSSVTRTETAIYIFASRNGTLSSRIHRRGRNAVLRDLLHGFTAVRVSKAIGDEERAGRQV